LKQDDGEKVEKKTFTQKRKEREEKRQYPTSSDDFIRKDSTEY